MPYKDPDKQREYQRRYKAKTKEWFWKYKATLSCESCGFSHPAAIQFHHKDESTKDGEVSRMVNQNLNKKTILEEITKCEVLCANCHAIHHYDEGYSGGRPRKKLVG